MRKLYFFLIYVMLVGCTNNYSKDTANLPAFNLLLSDSITIFNTKDIPKNNPSILIFFSPYCEHCQAETNSLLQHMNALQYVNFYFITIEPIKDMKAFNGYYKLHKYPNITVGRDYTFFFPSYFKNVIPPYAVLYDKNKHQKRLFAGETPASTFIAAIQKL